MHADGARAIISRERAAAAACLVFTYADSRASECVRLKFKSRPNRFRTVAVTSCPRITEISRRVDTRPAFPAYHLVPRKISPWKLSSASPLPEIGGRSSRGCLAFDEIFLACGEHLDISVVAYALLRYVARFFRKNYRILYFRKKYRIYCAKSCLHEIDIQRWKIATDALNFHQDRDVSHIDMRYKMYRYKKNISCLRR